VGSHGCTTAGGWPRNEDLANEAAPLTCTTLLVNVLYVKPPRRRSEASSAEHDRTPRHIMHLQGHASAANMQQMPGPRAPFLSVDPSDALNELTKRLATLSADKSTNEATTRLQLINGMLTNVLGWTLEQLNPEEYLPGGEEKQWIDYHLGGSDEQRLIVEAKRLGKTFYFSPGARNRNVRLRSLRDNHGVELREVIEQAIRYCHDSGTYAFIVTNGKQWIASYSGWPNIPTDKINAVVFYDLEDIAQNLQEFCDILSPSGIASQRLLAKIIDGESARPSFARSLNQTQSHNPMTRTNYLAVPMEALMRLCFNELTDDDHDSMLEFCYVTNDLTEGDFKRLEIFVGNTLPRYAVNAERLDRNDGERPNGAFSSKIRTRGETLLLLGKVGSGKSTFLRYATRYLRKTLAGNPWVLLELDLLGKVQSASRSFSGDRLTDELAASLLDAAAKAYPEYNPFDWEIQKGIFASDIQRELQSMPPSLRSAPDAEKRIDAVLIERRKQPLEFLVRYIQYLTRNRSVAVTVVIDNVDRGTEEFERLAFVFGQSLSRESGATVLIALRDITYYRSKNGGYLDVSQNAVFAISPPSFRDVVARRFDYVRRRLSHDAALSAQVERSMQGFDRSRVQDFVEIISDVVLRDSVDFQFCIQSLAGTNVRLALELLRRYCSSTNTDIDRLFREHKARSFSQPVDLLIASLMRGNNARYEEHGSPIVNLFQVEGDRITSHLMATRLLQYLDSRKTLARAELDVNLIDTFREMNSCRYDFTDLQKCCNHLGRHGLILSRTRPEPPWEPNDFIRISSSGEYYLSTLLRNRDYVRNVVDDTIVYDRKTAADLRAYHEDDSLTWPRRSEEKTKLFLSYLSDKESRELQAIGPVSVRPRWLREVVQEIAERLYGHEFSRTLSSAIQPRANNRNSSPVEVPEVPTVSNSAGAKPRRGKRAGKKYRG
jgi:energy-coupling factor transporter ATP-binding protein EcfA2